jgi:hypothetical protein
MGGFTFTNPAGLWLFGLLAVPVIVHLLERGRRRVVLMGSLRWIEPLSPPRWSRWRLNDLWRLLLRLALVSALVLAVSGFAWVPAASRVVTWVLVDPAADPAAAAEWLASSGADATLGEANREVRMLLPDFPAWRVSRAGNVAATSAAPLYSLLAEADRALPPGPVVVIAAEGAHRLGWRRPTLSRPVQWHSVPAAMVIDTDSRRGEPRGPSVPDVAPGESPSPRTVTIMHVARPADARRMQAAVDAWSAVAPGEYRVSVVALTPGTQPDADADQAIATLPSPSAEWILWLGDGTLPALVERRLAAGATVLTDSPPVAGGDAQSVAFLPGAETITIARYADPSSDAAPVWRGTRGEVLLTQRAVGEGTLYRFLGEFSSRSSALMHEATFPERLLAVLSERWRMPVPGGIAVAADQAVPGFEPPATRNPVPRPLVSWLALIAALLWLCDRLLARRTADVPAAATISTTATASATGEAAA